MNHVERFRAVMDFQSFDRLPRWEWAMWWDETLANWRGQGLPAGLESVFDVADYFGLDPYQQFWFSTTDDTIEQFGSLDAFLAAPQHQAAVVGQCLDGGVGDGRARPQARA